MTVTQVPPTQALAAVRTRHDDLLAGLTELTASFVATVSDKGPTRMARDRLVSFLRTELLPHAEAEAALLHAARTPATALLAQSLQHEHRMMAALIKEVQQGSTMDAVIAAGSLVVLCNLRIRQENEQLLPSLATAGLDLGGMLGAHPEIVGRADTPNRKRPASVGIRTFDLRGLGYYDRRHVLYTALRDLAPGAEVRVLSDRPHDLVGLRYDMEERIAQRYSWTTQQGEMAPYTIIRCPSRWAG